MRDMPMAWLGVSTCEWRVERAAGHRGGYVQDATSHTWGQAIGAGRPSDALTMPQPQISIVVPALNEGPNLAELVARIDAAMKSGRPSRQPSPGVPGEGENAGRDYEIIIVDDNSTDETRAVCAELSQKYPLKLI